MLVISAMVWPGDTQAQERASAIGRSLGDYGGFVGMDLRFSDMADGFAAFVGGHAALMLKQRVYLGLSGAGLASNPKVNAAANEGGTAPTIQMAYGGFLVGYVVPSASLAQFAVETQIAAGGVSLSESSGTDGNEDRDSLFLFEPAARAELNLAPILRLGFGIGYRFVGGVDTPGLKDKDLRGLTGSATVRLGWF